MIPKLWSGLDPLNSYPIQARDDSDPGKNDWRPIQIATPAIVGGVLLLLFALYILWQRRPSDKRSYDYEQVRSDWASTMERMFVPRRKRHRVQHSSAPVTLDDSMRASGLTFDFSHRSRQYRSGSSDSQTPLTTSCYAFDYPPKQPPESPPPLPKSRPMRWWWLFGSRPQQIKSEEPGQRWRVDGPDGSSSGHDHSNHGHAIPVVLAPLREEPEDADNVIRIGENFASVASTPMTQHFPEQANFVRGLPTVPEHPSSSGTRTPVPVESVPPSNPGTPVRLSLVLRECMDVLMMLGIIGEPRPAAELYTISLRGRDPSCTLWAVHDHPTSSTRSGVFVTSPVPRTRAVIREFLGHPTPDGRHIHVLSNDHMLQVRPDPKSVQIFKHLVDPFSRGRYSRTYICMDMF